RPEKATSSRIKLLALLLPQHPLSHLHSECTCTGSRCCHTSPCAGQLTVDPSHFCFSHLNR
ncbi:hypothetical protein BT96DRAFT_929548, partial [Gymnopus androsaceus JB14]